MIFYCSKCESPIEFESTSTVSEITCRICGVSHDVGALLFEEMLTRDEKAYRERVDDSIC